MFKSDKTLGTLLIKDRGPVKPFLRISLALILALASLCLYSGVSFGQEGQTDFIGPGKSWDDAENWTDGLPDKTKIAFVDLDSFGLSDCIVGSSSAVCKTLVIKSGTVTIDSGGELAAETAEGDGLLFMGDGFLYIYDISGVNVDFKGGTVVFTGADSYSVTATTFQNVQFDGSGTYLLSGHTTVNGSLTLSDGTLDCSVSNYNLIVGGGWSHTGGTFTSRNATVTFTGGTSPVAVTGNATTFRNLTINKSTQAGVVRLVSDCTVAGTLTLTKGVMQVESATIPGAARSLGTAGTTVVLAGSSAQSVPSITCANFQCNKSSSTATLAGALTVTENFTMTSGTLAAVANTINVYQNWTNNGGLFNAGTGTVVFTGDVQATISGSTTNFTNVVLSKAAIAADETPVADSEGPGIENVTVIADTLILGVDTVIAGNFTLTTGVFQPGSYKVRLQGNWVINGGSVTVGTSTLEFYGGRNSVMSTSGSSINLYNLTINKTINFNSITLNQALVLSGNYLQTSGTFIPNGNKVTVNGNWTRNGGVFTYGTAPITFSGSGNSAIGGSVANEFYSITLNKSANGATLSLPTGTTSLYGSLVLSSGTFQPGSSTLNLAGNYTNNGAATTVGTSTVYMNGLNAASVNGSSPSAFYNLTVAKPTGVAVSMTTTSTASNLFTLSTGNFNYSGTGALPGASKSTSAANTKVIFSGTGAQELSTGAGISVYYDLEINKTGGTATVNAPVTSSLLGVNTGALAINSITFTKGAVTQSSASQGIFSLGDITFANDASVVVTGNEAGMVFYKNWTKGAAATFAPGTGLLSGITYAFGTAASSIGPSNFNNLWIAKQGNAATVTGSISVTNFIAMWNNIDNSASSLNLGSYSHTVGGFLTRGVPQSGSVNLGKVNFQTSTVTVSNEKPFWVDYFGDTPTQQFDFGSGTVIYNNAVDSEFPTGYPMSNVTVNPSSVAAVVALTGPLTVQRNLTLSAGTVDVTASNHDLSIGGNLTKGGGSLNARAGTVTFADGSSSATVSGNGLNFNNVVLDKDAGGGAKGTLNWSSNAFISGTTTVTLGDFVLKSPCAFGNHVSVSSDGGLVLSTSASMEFPEAGSWIVQVDGGLFKSNPASGTVTIEALNGDDAYVSFAIGGGSTVDVTNLNVIGMDGDGMSFDGVTNFIKLQNINFGESASAQYLRFATTGLMLTCPGMVFDASVIDNGGFNVMVDDKDLGGDTYLIFENLATSGAGAGNDSDSDGDKGVGGDTTANDGYSDYGQGVVNWVTGKVFGIRSLVDNPNSNSQLLGLPKPVIDFNTFAVIGYVMGLINADTSNVDLLVLVDVAGGYVDSVSIDEDLGDMTGIAVATANEKGTGLDIDGDGVTDEDELQTLIYVTTAKAQVLRRLLDGGKFTLSGPPSGWDTTFDGSGQKLASFTSTPTADNLSVYVGSVDVNSINQLVWINHAEVGGTRTLQAAQTPDNCPALQTALLIQPMEGTPKAYVGTDTSEEDGSAHFYRIDAGVDLLIELDAKVNDPVKGVPALRNSKISFGTEGGQVVTVSFGNLSEVSVFTDEASPIRSGIFLDHLSKIYCGNLGGTFFSIDASNNLRYKLQNLGAPITGSPIAAGGVVFVPVGNTIFEIVDNPASPVIQRRITGNGTLSSVIVNSFNPGGPKFVTVDSSGFYVQY